MKSALLLKVFFATAVPFGLVVGLVLGSLLALIGIFPDAPHSVVQGAVAGLGLGAAAGLLFGVAILHFSQTADPRVHHRRTVVLDGSPQQARSMCVAAIGSIANARVENNSSTELKVVAKTRMTWRSWGDLITCDIRSTRPGEQTIDIESRPALRTTLVDYGSNLQNLDAIVAYFVASSDCRVEDGLTS